MWYVHPTLVVEVSIVESPVGERGAWEERGIVGQILNGMKYERIGRRERMCLARVRSRALITAGLGTIEVLSLSEEVSTWL